LILREDLELLRLADLRPALERLMIGHDAAALLPLTSHDELIGLLVVSGRPTGRALRREELAWLQRAGDRLAAALVYARMARQARNQVALEREVELAATVQAAFVPSSMPHQVGAVEIVGTWEPASQCGGDWWGYYALPGDRVLITIGDVTGHGVAAAMVTAAAKGSCDAAVRLMGADLDLPTLMARLDAAVRRVGAGRFNLTCFAAVIDPGAGEVRFANAGHVAPYLARDVGKPELELHALVARGNPLGAGMAATARTAHRALTRGDVLVWYTDGLIEGVDPDGQQFGDRRMQRTLRRLDRTRLDPETVHNVIAGAAADHRSGRPHDDDLTLVVARWQPAEAT
jgi:sigma-B regulation protein RsbU (phosphoserine phosphatase)